MPPKNTKPVPQHILDANPASKNEISQVSQPSSFTESQTHS
ncbi:7073_t:CDS:2, partial [Cetraspora pellucida]